MKLKVGRDELQHARLILADACLGFAAVRADLLGLGHVVLDADLRQLIVIRLTGSAWLVPVCRGIAGRRLGRQRWRRSIRVELEEVPLAGGLHQPFPPWAEDIAAVELDLLAQFFDVCCVFLDVCSWSFAA